MRTLRVLGLAEDGESLVCGDQHSGELFAVRTDERLRAAARGDLSRLGQLEIEMEPQLRPREIQARIRAGASIEEVASAASTRVDRIERYAYPVLLERSTMADKARLAHPVVDGNPAKKTLEELVTAALAERGQNADLRWDAYKDDDGWVLILQWQAGRSENRAQWAIQPGPRANTLRPKDEPAREILDPTPRTLREIHETKTANLEATHHAGQESFGEVTPTAADPFAEAVGQSLQQMDEPIQSTGSHHPAGKAVGDDPGLEQRGSAASNQGSPAPTQPNQHRTDVVARTGTDNQSSRTQRRGHRPVMPGWEDVLLGGGPTPPV